MSASVVLSAGIAALAVFGMSTSASAAGSSVATTLSFTTTSQQITDFSGDSVAATLKGAGGNAVSTAGGNCGAGIGTVTFAFVEKSNGTAQSVKGCFNSAGVASADVPSAYASQPLGTVVTVTGAFAPASGSGYRASITTHAATLTVSPTPVAAVANVDYSQSSPTKATVHGDLQSADGSGDYEKEPSGTWKLSVAAADGSTGFTVTSVPVSPGVDPKWTLAGLAAGTKYTATAHFTYPSSDAGRHTVQAGTPSTFTTTGTAPVATPTPTATATPGSVVTPVPTQTPVAPLTPQPTATAVSGAGHSASGTTTPAFSITPILYFVAGAVGLVIILAIIALIVYRRRVA